MRNFKNYTAKEKKAAKRIAYEFAFSIKNIILNQRFNYDARTRVGCLSAEIFFGLKIDKSAIKEIWRARKSNQVTTGNYLTNPLVLDYMRNQPTYVGDNKMSFNGRNHWAKNSTDLRILSVLKSHFVSK